MILQFPDLDTLHLALAGSVLDPSITLAPATLSRDAEGRPAINPSVAPSKSAVANLKKLGVSTIKKHHTEPPEEIANWLQALPTTRDSSPPALSSQAPVLFELADAADLPALVGEMLRLGNDRQSYRWFSDPAHPDQPRVLLRVIGPPYYTLLRALDRESAGSVRAYVERAPRVWVEVGHTHPFASQVRAAEKQSVLIRSPRSWLFLDDEPFLDVYELLRFELPSRPTEWEAAKSPTRIDVPLRLAAGNAADVPSFWVLRDDAVRQLDTLVRDSSDTLTARLMFAMAEDTDGKMLAVLRTRPSKQSPPVLALENAVGFKPYFKLNNLFVPSGRRLHPSLRRDAVRNLLAADPDQVVWLQPNGEASSFTPMSLPDSAFRALEDWVDYVIEAEQKPLAAWIESTKFEFESFVCKENEPKPPADPGKSKAPMPREVKGEVTAKLTTTKPKSEEPDASTEAATFQPQVEKRVDEWRKKRKELEASFLTIEGSLDAPERQSLWPALAVANAGAGDATEAAVCWLNAMWEQDDPPPAEWVAAWAKSERPNAKGPMTAAEMDERLKDESPTPGAARALAAGFLEVASQTSPPAWLASRLPAMQAFLEANERSLPIRAAWIAGVRLAHLAGADLLGLARLRDRLLQRLLEVGLSPERDLPGFLRFAGLQNSDRVRAVKDKILELHAVVRKWTEHVPVNLPYVDLYFAFALARLGETTEARNKLEAARAVMQVPVPSGGEKNPIKLAVVKNAHFLAFQYRIEQALAGKPHAGPVPDSVLAAIEKLAAQSRDKAKEDQFTEAEYAIAKLRQHSLVLEPHERFLAYSSYMTKSDPFRAELVALGTVRDGSRFIERVRKIYEKGGPGKTAAESRLPLLHAALPFAPRAGEAFVVELLNLVPDVLAAGKGLESVDDIDWQSELLQRSLQLAGLYDRTEFVPPLVNGFVTLVQSKSKDDTRFKLINRVAGHCVHSLRKFNLSGEIDRLLGRLQNEVIQASSVADLRKRYASDPSSSTWTAALQSLVHIAGGWLTFGHADHALPILDEARTALLGKKSVTVFPQHYAGLANAYLTAATLGPFQAGLDRLFEFFRTMEPGKITNATSTAPCFSRYHLEVVEALVWSLVSDDFALGHSSRRWLDDDEYLVRRRIHRDLRRHLDHASQT